MKWGRKRENKTVKKLGEKEEKNILNKIRSLKDRLDIFFSVSFKSVQGRLW